MGRFAIIDTETNWNDRVMSIGTVIADTETFEVVDSVYHILTPECLVGGMYEEMLLPDDRLKPILCGRAQAMEELTDRLRGHDVTAMFAYNASFDRNHLPELGWLRWYDIMRLAAYRQYNPRIPHTAECFRTGRLKRGYGVESMLRLLSGDRTYRETHNALYDALDELEIMRHLGYGVGDYLEL